MKITFITEAIGKKNGLIIPKYRMAYVISIHIFKIIIIWYAPQSNILKNRSVGYFRNMNVNVNITVNGIKFYRMFAVLLFALKMISHKFLLENWQHNSSWTFRFVSFLSFICCFFFRFEECRHINIGRRFISTSVFGHMVYGWFLASFALR